MVKRQVGLGRGLDAIMGSTTAAESQRVPVGYLNKSVAGGSSAASPDIMRIPVEKISANPYQPRLSFDKEVLDELAESIRTLGLIQPVSVRRTSDGNYQIISGERRYRACCIVGMKMIPAYVLDASDRGMLEMAIVENVQRTDLDPIETALGYQRLVDEYGVTQEEVASRVGKKRATVANSLRLLKLPVKVQHDLKVGLLSVGHAKVILGVDDPQLQEKLCDMVVCEGMNVRDLENLVKKILLGAGLPDKKSTPETLVQDSPSCAKAKDLIGKYFSSVTVRSGASGKGSITIKFSSESELDKFIEILER